MMRTFLALPFVLLAGCAGSEALSPSEAGMAGPKVNIPPPAMTAVFEGNDTFSFSAGSACSMTSTGMSCGFTVEAVPASTYDLTLVGQWGFTYQCVNSHNGKTNRQYPATAGTSFSRSLYYPSQSVSGTYTGAGLTQSLSGVAPANACASNRGAFTTMIVLSQTPLYWTIILGTSSGNYSYAAVYEFL